MKHLLFTSFLVLTLLLSACASNQSDEARDEASEAAYAEGGDAATTDLALEKLESELSDESATTASNGLPPSIEPPPTDGPNPSDPSLFAPNDVAMNDAAALQPPTEPNTARSAMEPGADGFAQTQAAAPSTGGTPIAAATATGGGDASNFADDEASLAANDPANYGGGKAAVEEPKAKKVKSEPPAPKAPKVVKAPELKTQPFTKKKANLNRYYFARVKNDSKSVSKLLYGNTKRSKDLIAWNGNSFTPGKIIYYESPYQPQDIEMRSFYEERSVPPTAYTFKDGDTLQSVAKQELGDKKSWTEIAIMNKLPDTASVTPNQQLAVYPRKLTDYEYKTPSKEQSIAATPEKQQAPQQAVPEEGVTEEKPVETAKAGTSPAPAKEAGAAAAATTVAKNDTPPSPKPPEKAPEEAPVETTPAPAAGFDFMKTIEQNTIPIAAGGGVVVLLLLLRLASKKKRKRAEVTTAGAEPTRVRSR